MNWSDKISARGNESPGGNHSSVAVPFLRLPNRLSPFGKRAARFHQLAETQSTLAGYLSLMATLAELQKELPESISPTLLPDSYADGPPLDISTWYRDPAWRESLHAIAGGLNPGSGPLAALLARIRQAADEDLDSWAERLLAGNLENFDPALAPFVAATLQVHWASAAARLDAGKIRLSEHAHLCPVCGFLPVASVLQTGGPVHGLRYLVCGLCASEWNRPRIQCVNCGSSKDVAYYAIEGAGEAVKTEACAACKTYLKVIDREKEPQADPFADDLASLSLDILMAEEGYQRLGFNPLLIPGG